MLPTRAHFLRVSVMHPVHSSSLKGTPTTVCIDPHIQAPRHFLRVFTLGFFLRLAHTPHPTPRAAARRTTDLRRCAASHATCLPLPTHAPRRHRSPRARARASRTIALPRPQPPHTASSRLSRTEPGAAPPRSREPSSVPRRFPHPRRPSPSTTRAHPCYCPCKRPPIPPAEALCHRALAALEATMASRAAPGARPAHGLR